MEDLMMKIYNLVMEEGASIFNTDVENLKKDYQLFNEEIDKLVSEGYTDEEATKMVAEKWDFKGIPEGEH